MGGIMTGVREEIKEETAIIGVEGIEERRM